MSLEGPGSSPDKKARKFKPAEREIREMQRHVVEDVVKSGLQMTENILKDTVSEKPSVPWGAGGPVNGPDQNGEPSLDQPPASLDDKTRGR